MVRRSLSDHRFCAVDVATVRAPWSPPSTAALALLAARQRLPVMPLASVDDADTAGVAPRGGRESETGEPPAASARRPCSGCVSTAAGGLAVSCDPEETAPPSRWGGVDRAGAGVDEIMGSLEVKTVETEV
ncbi:hypothetical protein GCM10028785_35300 [Hydrogenophaga soli]